MVIDKQGRICLGQKLCEEFGYKVGSNLRFAYEGNGTYKLVKPEDISESDRLIRSGCKIQEKGCRICIPLEIRNIYSNNVVVYGKREDSCIYIEFLAYN